ncbi:MAG: TatD family hydrolase [Deltaproteobacteria bacterium]|nr:TatD family hydrolase [Deltaproteobacteria bacterium]
MLIDSHAHLDMKDFDKDRDDVIERAVAGCVGRIVTIGIDLASSRKALDIARNHAFIYSTVGYHPHDAKACRTEYLEELVAMAADPKVVAWGEIGLDFFRHYSPEKDQKKVFERQLEMARDLDLPVIIHDRDAHEQVFSALKRMGKGENRGVIHCFSGDLELADALIDLGYYISIPGTVTYKKASDTREVAARMPLERMLVETDAPFLAPVPKRGKRNEPFYVTYTAQEISRLRDTDVNSVAEATTRNAMELFGLPSKDPGT